MICFNVVWLSFRRWSCLISFLCFAQLGFTQCQNYVSYYNFTIDFCNPATNTFTYHGSVGVATQASNAALGVLTLSVTNNSGTYTITIPGPYVNGGAYNYSVPNIPSDGSAITTSMFFSGFPECTWTDINAYPSPDPCGCESDAGTFSQTLVGNSNSNAYSYQLCYGDVLYISANGDDTPPTDLSNYFPTLAYDPSISLVYYTCPPTVLVPNDINTDPCFGGVASLANGNWNIPNNLGSQQTLYFAPLTMYSLSASVYAPSVNGGDYCYDLGPVYEVTYLSQITNTVTQNCMNGTATATITGGMPAFNGSDFTRVPGSLTPISANFVNTSCGNGGTIQISGLSNGDNFSFDVVDSKNCPVTISGTYSGPNQSNFSYAQAVYCANDVDPSPTLGVNSTAGGVYSSTPAGLSINSGTGVIDLSASTAGDYVVNYATTGSYCPTNSNFSVKVNAVPNVSVANQSACANESDDITALVNPAGSYNFAWTVPAGAINPGNVNNFSASVAGNYSVIVTNPLTNCASNPTTGLMTIHPLPTVFLADEEFCVGDSATLTAVPNQAGVVEYLWNVPGGANVPGNVASFNSNQVGWYSVQVKDGNNCFSTVDSAFVTVNQNPSVSINDSTFCIGSNALLTATPNVVSTYTYSWTVPAGATDPGNVNSILSTVAGAYDVQITDVNTGCFSSVSTGTIVVNPLPIVTMNNPETCAGDSASLIATANGTSAYNYNWTVPTGVNPPGNVSSVLTPISGNYDVYITDTVTGCVSLQTSGFVTVNPNPTVTVNSFSVCDGFTDQFVATPGAPSGYSYAWTVPIAATNPGNVPTFFAGDSGVYSVVITDLITGCFSPLSTGSLIVHLNPVVNAGFDQMGCVNDSFVLSGSGAGPGGTYHWSNNVTDGVAFYQAVGTQTYTVVGTTVEGCVGTDDVDVLVDVTPVVSFSYLQDRICAPAAVTFSNTSSPAGVNCFWTFDDGSIINGCGTITNIYDEVGSFGASLTVESAIAGCVADDYQANIVTVVDFPVADFVFEPQEFSTLFNEVSFTNLSTGALDYSWDFGDEMGYSNEVNPQYAYTNENAAYYEITLIANLSPGCVDSMTKSIVVNEELLFFIPNAFTPDNNEFNDVFKPVFTSGIEPQDYQLMIFNRWGEVIFESNDAELGWDGTYGAGGKVCQSGIYSWKVTFQLKGLDDRRTSAGHVSLLR